MSAPFDVRVEAYLGPLLGWVDVTDNEDVRDPAATHGGGITVTRAIPPEGQQVDPGRAMVWLNNRHGKYSPRNLAGPYYGLLGRNAPIRFGIRLVRDTFGRTVSNGWGTADTGQAYTTLGGASSFAVAGGFGTHAHPTINVLRRTTLPRVLTDCEQVVSTKVSAAVTGAAMVTGARFRVQSTGSYYWLRTEFDRDSSDIILKITRVDHSNNFFDLAVLDPVPGLGYAAGTLIRSRASVCGNHLAIKAWLASGPEPLDWQLTVTDETIAAAGLAGMQTWAVAGNTNSPTLTVSFDNYEVIDRRAHMEVPAWPPRWDLSERDRWVPIEAAGILRRLGKGNPPVLSALYREVVRDNPTAYWSLEDEEDSSEAVSPIAGVEPMRPFNYSRFDIPGSGGEPEPKAGAPRFGSGEGIPGSAAVVDLAQGGVLHGVVPTTGNNRWRIEWTMVAPRDKAGTNIPMQWATNGTWSEWRFQIEAAGIFATFGDGVSNSGSASASLNLFDGQAHHFQVNAFSFAGQTDARIYVDDVQVAQYDSFTPPMTGNPGDLTEVIVNPLEVTNGDESMPIIGHVTVWNYSAGLTNTAIAALGWVGETAADRITRLSDEENVPVVIRGDPAESARMGAQRPGAYLDLVEDAANADRGLWYEARDQLGMVYRTHRTLYSQTAVELDYSAGYVGEPFEPTPDDEQVVNDVTITRTGGASYRAVQETGPLSVQRPPNGVGSYPGPPGGTVNVYVDEQARRLAHWERHRGTWDEERYPAITVNLRAEAWVNDPDRAAQVAALDPGDLLAVTSPPVDLPPAGTEQLVRGSTEVLNPRDRVITWNTVPGGPYRIAVANAGARANAVGSTVGGSGISISALSFTLTSIGRPWTTNPANFPMLLDIGEETVTATSITGATNSQTVALSARGPVPRAWLAGTPVNVHDRRPAAL